MDITKVRIVSIQETLLALSLFLYPFIYVNHTLYIIPQALFTLMAIWGTSIKLNISKILMIFFGIIAFIIPMFIEYSVVSTNQDLFVKLVVNSITIFAIAISPNFSLSENILKKIKICVYAWLIIIFIAYSKTGLSGISVVISGLMYGDSLSSSSLYEAATPLKDIFITKNISSMFMVAVFSFYVYLSVNFEKKVSNFISILFFILALAFVSRQGLLGFLAILFLYKYRYFGKVGKLFTIASAFFVISFVFKKLFDLSNSADGASERVMLWRYFFAHYNEFLFTGMGLDALNANLITKIGIDNFHMFFMNQIGAYGVFHFITFSLFLILIYINGNGKFKLILVLAYFMNILFQAYGYEFGNLFLFMTMLIHLKYKVDPEFSNKPVRYRFKFKAS
ncbi:hypothetical protein F4T82_01915 [Acinetobacter lwoffii]|uniref:hypothetical protein n=1 Tax=Acinetobacter lwoffii TaxID=28090 RepID=UPI0012986142|nr:hypothetical protein [Acinetobacter lwoffii]MRA02537.1 hypothetical protein [Acinetobacter lwoffii]